MVIKLKTLLMFARKLLGDSSTNANVNLSEQKINVTIINVYTDKDRK